MNLDKRTREQLLAHCGQLHEDDGVDPRQFFGAKSNRRKENHKSRQLCKQVAETLSLVLASEFGDHRLQGLQVVSVTPEPNASQLLVTLCSDHCRFPHETDELITLLNVVNGRLRSAVANAISRKRAPQLSFRLALPGHAEAYIE